MKATNCIAVAFLLLIAAGVSAQESAETEAQPSQIRVSDMESLTVSAIRKQFPQLPGMFASVHSCRLPEYGPLVSVTVQLPANFFTRPILLELEKRHKAAEAQARRMRREIEKAAQIITLKVREAGLLEQLESERTSKKKARQQTEELQKQLDETRASLISLEKSGDTQEIAVMTGESLSDVDLNKMLISNYNVVVQKISTALEESLVENSPRLIDLEQSEKVSIHAHIRDGFLGSQGNTVLFTLRGSDIDAFRRGELDRSSLKERIVVMRENKE